METPVYSIGATSSTGYSGVAEPGYIAVIPIGTGCTISMKTTVNGNSKDWYTIPNNKKLTWESANPGALTAKNGKIKCSSTATVGSTVDVTVKANDGWGTSLKMRFRVVDAVKKLYFYDNGRKLSGMTYTGSVGGYIEDPLYYHIGAETQHNTGIGSAPVEVSISNWDVIFRAYDDNDILSIFAAKPGTAKYTVKALDGSNKKITVTFKIKARTLKGL